MSAAAERPARGRRRRLHRIEPTAVVGVMSRDATVFTRNWKTTSFSSVVEPVLYLTLFSLGFGKLISSIGGLSYKQYVGTGIPAMAVLFSSAFPGLYGTFLKYRFQRTYDAFLAAPVDVDEIVSAEIMWIGLRAGVYGNVPLLVAIAFGLDPKPTALLVPFVCFVAGTGFVGFGVMIAALGQSLDNFSYITSGVLTPMFLTAGTFFPVSNFPPLLRAIAHVNPLYHCVQLIRDLAVLGVHPGADLIHLGALAAFALLMWRLAIWRLRLRLID